MQCDINLINYLLACTNTAAGMVNTAHWLISTDVRGSIIHAKDKNGDTPAHDAAESG